MFNEIVRPEISVIITTYNRVKFLPFSIETVLNQSFNNIEILVVDDGSNDGTKDFIKKNYKNINYIYQENQGISKARNTGILNSTCKYIAFLDSDDRWEKKKLEIQYNQIINDENIALNYTDEIWLRNGKYLNQKQKHKKYSGHIFDKCLPLCIISPSSALIKREVFQEIGLFDEQMKVCEDYDLWLRICLKYPVFFIDKKLIIKYGGQDDQLSRKYWGMDRFRIYSLLKLLKNNLDREKKLLVINEIRKKYRILKIGCLKRNKYPKEILILPY